MKPYYLIALVASLFGLGCGTYVNTTELNSPPHSMVPRPADAVEVYSSAPPTRAHVDVALLEANQDDGINDTAKMVQKLREAAGARGCDAVFISGRSGTTAAVGTTLAASRVLSATCIVYLSERTQHNAASASQEGVGEGRAPLAAPPQDGDPKR